MADRRGNEVGSDLPVTRWQHEDFVATPCRVGGGFRKRRSLPALELVAGALQTVFLCSELGQFFGGKIDNIEESSAQGELVYLYRVTQGVAYPGITDNLPVGSIVVLASKPAMHPAFVLPPGPAADFGHWYQALPSW